MKGGIRAVVLAAGESTRMGTNKLLLPFKDKTIITVLIDNIIHSEVDGVLVVLGAYREEILNATAGWPVTSCYNPDYPKGMLSSIRCGFRNLPADTEAAMIFPGDQPMISTAVINQIIREFRTSAKGIAVPLHRGQRGHPVLIDMKYAIEIMEMDHAKSLGDFIRRHPMDALELETGEPGILRDIDTMEDYQSEIKSN